VDEDLLGAVIIDYKTSEVTRQREADRRVAENLQLKMYALAWREMTAPPPDSIRQYEELGVLTVCGGIEGALP